MPEEEEGNRPVVSFEADEPELAALGEVIGAAYEPTLVHAIDAHRSIHRVPAAFVSRLAQVTDPASTARDWQARCASMRPREASSLEATLVELREFAASAVRGRE